MFRHIRLHIFTEKKPCEAHPAPQDFSIMGSGVQAAACSPDLFVCVAQECSTDNTGIISQLCNHDFCILGRIPGVNLPLYTFLHRNQKRIALVADTAAEAQNIGLDDVDGIGDASCQERYLVSDYLLCS